MAAPDQPIEPLALERVLAEQRRLQMLDQPGAVDMGAVQRRAEESVALDPLVGGDGQQAELAGASELADMRVTRSTAGSMSSTTLDGRDGDDCSWARSKSWIELVLWTASPLNSS